MIKVKNIKTKRRAIALKYTGDNKKEVEEFLSLKLDKTDDEGLFRLGERIPVGSWVIKEYDDCSKSYRCEHTTCATTKDMKKLYIKDRANKGGQCTTTTKR